MTRYALVLVFLTILVAKSLTANNVQTIYKMHGGHLNKIGPVDNDDQVGISHCEIKNNNGTIFAMYPESTENDGKKEYGIPKFSLRFMKCQISVYKMLETDSGSWEVRMNKTNGETKVAYYNIKVRKIYKEKPSFPGSDVKVYPNQQVSIHFKEDFKNLVSCKLLTPENIEYDLASEELPGINLHGKCGFKMVPKKENTGQWTLIADLNNNTAYYSTVNIFLKDQRDLKPTQINLSLKQGEKGIIRSGNAFSDVKMCILEDPRGIRLPVTSGPCSHTINFVTKFHEGIWKAYYGLDGVDRLVEQKIIVHTYDMQPLNSSVTVSKNGDINLLCRVHGSSLNFCNFIRPDGEILYMSRFISNKKYEYYGKGLIEDEDGMSAKYDCGIIIHNPDHRDFGAWRCMVGVGSSKTLGRVLKVNSGEKTTGLQSFPVAKSLHVKLGDSYQVKCRAEEVLSYCWLRSPNGTVFSVSPVKNAKSTTLEYDGEGLELGDCSALIEQSTEADSGKWTCHMGIVNGPEIEAEFKIVVKDSYLMAPQETILFESLTNTDLICQVLPDTDKVIETCRWINPVGRGIHVDKDRYYTETTSSYCRLSIRNFDFNEDFGEWSCYARFSDSQEESKASIMVTYEIYGFSTPFIQAVIVTLLSIMIISLLITCICKRPKVAKKLYEKIYRKGDYLI